MRICLSMPNFAEFGDPETAVAIAREADKAGWDGLFLWDHINVSFGPEPLELSDPWILLAAMAQATERILLGPMVTPLPRRRPWVLARQTATFDRLSKGRLVLGVGLGWPPDTEYAAFGEDPDVRVRAEKLDEGLAILTGLWSGEPFEFSGKHYQVARTQFSPTPVQRPRPPILVAGTWPKEGPLRRAARWDGYVPLKMVAGGSDFVEEFAPMTFDDIRAARARLEQLREGKPVEIMAGDEVEDDAPRDPARLREYADAGVTWYTEGLSTRFVPLSAIFDRIKAGPPRF